jgi:hypothetical protein
MKILLALIFSAVALPTTAQMLQTYETYKTGDTISYATRVGLRSYLHEFQIQEVLSGRLKGTVTIDNKKMDYEAPAQGFLGKEFCLAKIMECEWTPPVKIFDNDLKVNDEWSLATRVKMQDGTVVDEQIQSVADKFERLSVPAGEFDSIRISSNGEIKATAANGVVYVGTLKMTTWAGVVNGRLVMLKRTYSNSFRQSFSQELRLVAVGN